MSTEVHFYPMPIIGIAACTVPVLPGSPTVMRDDEPIPMEERTEMCATTCRWMIGMQPLCDHHLRETCELIGVDLEELLDEAGKTFHEWPDGERDFDLAVRTRDHFNAP